MKTFSLMLLVYVIVILPQAEVERIKNGLMLTDITIILAQNRQYKGSGFQDTVFGQILEFVRKGKFYPNLT